jgi:putative SOS response-associated peptidase YedK
MCNLYSLTRSQDEIRQLARALRDIVGNLPPLPGIYPDTMAPVVRTAADGVRELALMRWGFPPPPSIGTRPVTNVRNVKSGYWRPWLKPEQRCLVPVTSFCEWTDSRPKVTHWFALSDERPLFWFAGIWRPWTGDRRGEVSEHRLFAFLTTQPNAVVAPIHAKAMPVVLSTEQDCETWLTAPAEAALALQRPAPDDLLRIVATGTRTDSLAA